MTNLIAGMDEAGMGALAGPIVVATTAFRVTLSQLPNCKDSKKLSRNQRAQLIPHIQEEAAFIGVGWASSEEINYLGLVRSWHLAAGRSLHNCPELSLLIVDGVRGVKNLVDVSIKKQRVQPKADEEWWQCSSASNVAKALRDQEMIELNDFYRGYSWDKNMGYGSKQHRQSLKELGPCKEHRKNFVKNLL